MSIEKLLQKHQATMPTDLTESDSVEDQGTYGIVRAHRERALMLELRKKNGDILAIPYAVIEQVRFSSTEGITIFAGGHELRVRGRHLNKAISPKISLLSGICRHRVAWIEETSRTKQLADVETSFVESVAF